MKRILIILLAILLVAVAVQARTPRTMNVQGVLTDDAGNTLPDAHYTVRFMLWDSEIDGSDLWNEDVDVTQSSGFFNATLGLFTDFDPAIFNNTLWLSMQIVGDSVMEPRIQMTSTASSLMAARVERGAAVLSLNGLKNNVTLQAGANVSITQADSTLTISATTGAGGDDGDWAITGDDLHKDTGHVFIGGAAAKIVDEESLEGSEAKAMPAASKLQIVGVNEGLAVQLVESTTADGNAAIYGELRRGARNHGTAVTPSGSNAAIMGQSITGDEYAFGVAGFVSPTYANTGAVVGAHVLGTYWAALAHMDASWNTWGVYTNDDIHADGLTETNTLRVNEGASAGYILTSDANGNAAWSPPTAAGSDGDWEISGQHLTHAAAGTVALGIGTPHPLAETSGFSTVQISSSFAPALCLDATYGGLSRWAMFQTSDKVQFSHSSTYAGLGTVAASIEDGALEVKDFSGGTSIRLQGEGSMETGSRVEVYSTSPNTSLPTVTIDSQSGSTSFGGSLTLRDGYGQNEVEITANHNGTNVGRITTPVLEITGGADLSEQFNVGNLAELTKPGMVVSIDPKNPGRLELSGCAYDRRVAGVISGAGGVNTGMVMGQRGTVADGELPVALVGRVYVWADASEGSIEPGDLLTTSERPGHAMRVNDPVRATGAILGKAMTGLDEGQGLILTLVTLQ